jgi:hypothetical protein
MRAAGRGASARGNDARGQSDQGKVLHFGPGARQDGGGAKIEPCPIQLDIEDAIHAKTTGPPSA